MALGSRGEGTIFWSQDLAGSTSSRLFATLVANGANIGVPSSIGGASRIWVAVDATASASLTCTVSLYGFTAEGDLRAGQWLFLRTLNAGASMTPNQSTIGASSTRILYSEVFEIFTDGFSRYGTAATFGGTSPVVSTYIGISGVL